MATAAEQEKQKKAKEYEKYVKQVTPTHSLFKNMCRAFLSGGAICVLGQGIMNFC
ncbi:SpoVA/SpoVAEb family sporulation membrane protein, partial [Blautia pseudococcoides]|nr:SpoVA/SpoVAEb family sporulation membrane protein [Blautia pseudococcoides]